MRTVFLVPRRDDNGPRDRIWAWCKARWEREFPDVQVFEGYHTDGPFNRSAAVNAAARAAGDWDLGIVIDSDVFLRRSQVQAAVDRAADTGRVTWAHRRWRGIREDATTRIVADLQDFGPEFAGHDMDLIVERTNPISWSCCIVIPRAVWDDMGGFDERFVGWGFEDMAAQSLIVGLYGHERIEGDVYHLFHPRSEERIVPGQGRMTATPEYVTNARLGRRYMYAVRRDHGLHDRPDASDAAEMQRDLANLKADDAKYSPVARRLGLPDWDEWWPTLEELRDGAKAHRAGPPPSVTLIVHTDGRRDYIARSIPSLLERIHGPITKRVIYDDSGDPGYKAWLRERFPLFNVVGPETRLGYTGSMRAMWTYLETRCSAPYVFRAEDDFIYDRDVDLAPMMDTLDENPHLRQLVLLRGPYYPREIAAGSILAEKPDAYELRNSRPHPFVEHREYFSANPSLFRRSLVKTPWPSAPSSERVYTEVLNRDPASRFAYWGDGSEPWITHIGAERSPAAAGY